MKRIMALALVMVLALSLLTACNGGNGISNGTYKRIAPDSPLRSYTLGNEFTVDGNEITGEGGTEYTYKIEDDEMILTGVDSGNEEGTYTFEKKSNTSYVIGEIEYKKQ